jgi:hypothetical protein
MTTHTGSPPSPEPGPSWQRIDAVADAKGPPRAYEEWLSKAAPSTDDYLFSARIVRFAARDDDRLLGPPDLAVRAGAHGVELASQRLGGSLALPGIALSDAERITSLFDGVRTLADVRGLLGDARRALDALVEAAFGRVLFTPGAIAELEARISGTELTRFVGTPYEVERAYWENMADVRALSDAALAAVRDTRGFVQALRRLHVVALLGADLSNFYRPASRISAHAVQPGALYDGATRSEDTQTGTLIIEGPRVGVPFVGGKTYHALVCEHDPAALDGTRTLRDENGLGWGRVVRGRAVSEPENRDWFLPPRPIENAHWEALFAAYVAAESASRNDDSTALPAALARFHFRFVRLHPFRCANQSLSMNLVNRLLLLGSGRSMPHGLLDQFALRLTEAAYEVVFSRAAARAPLETTKGLRWTTLRAERDQVFEFIQRLQGVPDLRQARSLCEQFRDAAKAALVV